MENAMTYPQPPVMTAAHAATLRQVISLWPYPFHAERDRLTEILHHLDALLEAPAPTTAYGFDDWRLEYKPLDPEDCYDCDQ